LILVGIQILATTCTWLGLFAAIGFTLAVVFASHASGFFFHVALIFGAFGAAGEVGYLFIERWWGRPKWPRWLSVGIWTLMAPTLAFAAMEINNQQTDIVEVVVLLMTWSVLPVFAVAYIASWLFR
jgi:hypothetical protein